MKIENEDLLKLKININCKNTLAYQDIAYLVDKPEFLSLLTELRAKYQIKKLIPLNDFENWYLKKLKEDLRIYGTEKKMLSEAKRLYGDKNKKPTDKELFDSWPYHQKFDWETKLLTRKFNRPSYFNLIIKQAIVCGEVDDASWQPTYATVLPQELPLDGNDLPEVVIVISPMSRLTDVEKVFKEEVPNIFKNEKWKFKYQITVKKDTTVNIIRDRNWYWLSLEGKEPRYIYNNDIDNPKSNNIYLEAVTKAITRYKEKLQDKF
jgi:hypothetical protein